MPSATSKPKNDLWPQRNHDLTESVSGADVVCATIAFGCNIVNSIATTNQKSAPDEGEGGWIHSSLTSSSLLRLFAVESVLESKDNLLISESSLMCRISPTYFK